MSNNCNSVLKQFFQPYYEQRIENIKNMSPTSIEIFDLSVLTFWSSVIDFYGGLYYLGSGRQRKLHGSGRKGDLKLAHKEAFVLFINDFFPSPENNYGDFFYDIFRCGIVHQICAKKSHIHLNDPSGANRFMWIVEQQGNMNPRENKESHINLLRLQDLTYQAYYLFKNSIQQNNIPNICENIYNELLSTSDGLEDGKALDAAFTKLITAGFDLRK